MNVRLLARCSVLLGVVCALHLAPATMAQSIEFTKLDHFLIYDVEDLPVPLQDDITLVFRSGLRQAREVVKHRTQDHLVLTEFANPTVKTTDTAPNGHYCYPEHHITLYDLVDVAKAGPFTITRVRFANQFGVQVWHVSKPLRLLVPALKQGGPKPNPKHRFDHYKSYAVAATAPTRRTVDLRMSQQYKLVDQWLEKGLYVKIDDPVMFAFPVAKTHGVETPVEHPSLGLAIYRIDPIGETPTYDQVEVDDQFTKGMQATSVDKPVWLAVPSLIIKATIVASR